MMLIIDLLGAVSFHKWLIFFVWLPIIVVKNSELFSLFTFKKISLSDSRLVGPSSIKRHFLKIIINPVNKENKPLFLTAMLLRIPTQKGLLFRKKFQFYVGIFPVSHYKEGGVQSRTFFRNLCMTSSSKQIAM